MADTSVKISLEVLDKALIKALGDVSARADGADKSIAGLGKSSKATFAEFSKGIGLGNEGLGSFGSAIGNISSLFSTTFLASTGLAAGAVYAFKSSLDLIKEAEQVKAVSSQFEALAQNAGVSSEALKGAFVGAVDGLVDDTDLVKSANKALIELGEFATELPNVMTIARKASVQFGGEITQNFDLISQAIASGNTRSLRQIGLFIDAEKVNRAYAESLGVTAKDLSDTERRQALLNAVLEKGNEAFKTVNEANLSTTNNLTRLGVAFSEVKETGAAFFDRLFGGATSAAIGSFSSAISGYTRIFKQAFGTEQEAAKIRVEDTAKTVTSLQKRLEEQAAFIQNNKAWLEQSGQLAQVQAQYESLRRQVGTLSESQEKADELAMKRSQAIGAIDQGRITTVRALTDAQKQQIEQEQKAREQKAESLVKEADSPEAKFARDLELLQAQREAELIVDEEFFARKQELAVTKFLEEQAAIDDLRKNNAFPSEQEYFIARDNLAQKFATDQAKRDAEAFSTKKKQKSEYDKWEKQSEQERAQFLLSSTSNMFGGLAALASTGGKKMFEITRALSLAETISAGVVAVQKAAASAPPPFNVPGIIAATTFATANVVRLVGQRPPSFEQGGIVPGTSFSGDNVSAQVNSGEMILNRTQQTKLFEMANTGGGSGLSGKIESLLSLLASRDEVIVVNIGGRTVVETLRSELASGRSFA